MRYLESFFLPIRETEEDIMAIQGAKNGGTLAYLDNTYPCGLFSKKDLYDIYFSPMTVFYGGNGSGKSTLLNLIAQKLKVTRVAPFNTGEMFDAFVNVCSYQMADDDEGNKVKLPKGSRIITSDDIFDYMLAARSNNEEIAEKTDEVKAEWTERRFGRNVQFNSMEDYDDLRLQLMARSKSTSRRKYVKKMLGEQIRLHSNGETALQYFEEMVKPDALYLLDEPENSMSPKLQLELKDMLERASRYLGCQFIIATHSPFLLSMQDATVYDLDQDPVRTQNWWDLENVRTYYEFFKENERFFRK